MVQLQREGVRWELAPDFQPFLDEVVRSKGEIVKETPAKLVSLVERQGHRFYVKRYRYFAVPFRPYKYLFQLSQPRQEWQLAAKMESQGIPIVRHVALGERWKRGGLREGILITEGFQGVPVKESGHAFADKVLAVIRLMHEAGAIQHDLHGANILVNPDSGEVRLVDLHGTIFKTRLSEEEKMENLARLRKFQAVEVPAEIEKRGWDMRREMYHRRSYRAWKQNREFASQRYGGLRWQVRLDKTGEEMEGILNDPDGFLDTAATKLKNGRSSTVAAHGSFVLKRYNFKKPLNLIKDLFRASRSKSSFRKAYHLETAGIATAAAVAAADRRVFGMVTGGYFLMERIPGAVSLRDYRGDLKSTVTKVAELIANLHDQGFSHRDLKTANIMFDQDGQPVLIDLDGLSFENVLRPFRAGVDLKRLHLAAQDHPQWNPNLVARFLRHYCRHRQMRPRTLKMEG